MRSSWLALVFIVVGTDSLLARQAYFHPRAQRDLGVFFDDGEDGDVVARTETARSTGFTLSVLQPDERNPGFERARRSFYANSLALPAGASVGPIAEPAGLRVALVGRIRSEISGRYRLGVEVFGGTARLCCGSHKGTPSTEDHGGFSVVWTDWIDAPSGLDTTLTIWAERNDSKEFLVKPLWERENSDDRGFRPEPIPTHFVDPAFFCTSHPTDRITPLEGHSGPPNYEKHARKYVEHKRVLTGQFGCMNCHTTGRVTTVAPPTRKGPDLTGIGERVHASWLAEWVANPQALKPGAGMPDVFRDTPADDADLEALLAYLLDGADPEDVSIANEEATLAQGRELYHTLGCIACHGALASPADVFDEALLPHDVPNVPVAAPFADLHEKWRPGALAGFLKDPRATWPESPMPSMDLSDEEADLIATYLLSREERHSPNGEQGSSTEDRPELVSRGREVFVARGCANCHIAPDVTGANERSYAEPNATPMTEWRFESGCWSGNEDSTTPRYDFGLLQVDGAPALLAYADHVADAPLDRAFDTYATLNCQACHARDGQGGLPDELRPYFIGLEESAELGDEARIPPELSGVGRKLTTPWLEEVLTNSGRARPYMAARMPQFAPDEVRQLAHGLAYQDGVFPHTDRDAPAVTDEQVLAGKRLMGIRGLACISCHVVGDLPPAGTPGPDMTQFAARLRYDWFRDYMHDPARFKPGTRMPQFTTKGKSAIVDLWDGDAERQIDAMWAYFSLGEFLPVPAGVPKPGELALVPKDRPVVFRTFLESVGSKAICVGTPSGLHYAFDAEKVRLAEVWKGDFVDASANWTARGGGEANGRGEVTWEVPFDNPLAFGFASGPDGHIELVSEARADFQGYRLDSAGVPTFVYDLMFDHEPDTPGDEIQLRVDEAVIPYPRAGIAFARMFAVRGLPGKGTLILQAPEEPGVTIGAPEGDVVPGMTYLSVWTGGQGRAGLWPDDGKSFLPSENPIEFFGVEAVESTNDDEPIFFSIEVAE